MGIDPHSLGIMRGGGVIGNVAVRVDGIVSNLIDRRNIGAGFVFFLS